MHCELAVPGLFAGATDARAPALELLLARGRAATTQSRTLEAWLQQAFGLEGRSLVRDVTVGEIGGGPLGDLSGLD